MRNPHDLVPRDKYDLDRVQALIEVGCPDIEPVLDEILAWTFDGNWPVAHPLAAYLCSIGQPIVAPVEAILAGGDEGAKWFWLGYMSRYMSRDFVTQFFAGELHRLASRPSAAERREEVHLQADETLAWLQDQAHR